MANWYDITFPKDVTNKGNDLVAYKSRYMDEKLKPKGHFVADSKNAACYWSHMQTLNQLELTCMPNETQKSLLPPEIYMRWMNLCKDHGLVTADSTPYTEKDLNYLVLPGAGHTRHELYASLCCYRWAENLACMPYAVVALLDMKPLNFYQALHYAMAKWVIYVNHSFCNIDTNGASTMYDYRKSLRDAWYLPHGMAVSFFFTKNENGRSPAMEPSTTPTCTCVLNSIRDVFGLETYPKEKEYCVTAMENLLWECWTPLYKMPEWNKRHIDERYNSALALIKDAC